MPTSGVFPRRADYRDLLLFRSPQLWPHWPFLPLVRYPTGGGSPQLGVLYDARGATGTYGYSATVWLVNLFLLPDTETQLFARPKCVYDTTEELADDGWVVG